MTQRNETGINPSFGENGNRRRSPEEIEAEITRTRSAISEDINELGEKLSPDRLRATAKDVLHDAKEEAKDFVRETKDAAVESLRHAKDSALESVSETVHDVGVQARRASRKAAHFAADNAIPLGLIGLGVAWLTLRARKERLEVRYADGRFPEELDEEFGLFSENDYQRPSSSVHLGERGARRPGVVSKARRTASRAGERLEEARETTRERVGEVASHIAEAGSQLGARAKQRVTDLEYRAHELSQDARERLHRAQLEARDFARENPLAVGAAAVAVGVGVGLLLPATERETQFMGAHGARLVDEARETARRVQYAAKEAAQEVKAAVREPNF
jgi:ElaB/YqjD/DUF883 family membrane-anchored ribosome-binding protein